MIKITKLKKLVKYKIVGKKGSYCMLNKAPKNIKLLI